MSDFESEHDSDSGNEGEIPTMPSLAGSSAKTEADADNSKSALPEAGADNSTLLDYYNEINSGYGSNDLLSDLKKKAGLEKKVKEKPKLEPWQQYLEEKKESDAYLYKDPTDGTVYEWDAEKRAWFPKIDENFIAAYQASYGFTEDGVPLPPEKILENSKPKEPEEKKKNANDEKAAAQKRKAEEPGWFEIDQGKNNNVYVSGLPLDTTEEEFVEMMSKYGIIMEDPETEKMKVKLYRDKEGKIKGDGRCCFLRGESVSLALQLLDDLEYKGNTIHVEQAVFALKGDYNPSLKPKRKKKKKKKQAGQEKMLDWVERDKKRSKFDRIVIVKHMFDVQDFERDPTLIIDLQEEIRTEVEKFGILKKVLVFDRNPEGVCSLLFKEPEMADECVAALNGRWFGGKKLTAESYDGTTNYQVTETEEELKRRLGEWEEFLAQGEELEEKTEPVNQEVSA